MSVLRKKVERRLKIKKGIRSRVFGTPEKPRLSVFRSNKDIYVQIIDDVHGKTLASASSKSVKDKMTKEEYEQHIGEFGGTIEEFYFYCLKTFDRSGKQPEKRGRPKKTTYDS